LHISNLKIIEDIKKKAETKKWHQD
jgi:hypothetical protein